MVTGWIEVVGPERAVRVLGVKLLGVNAVTGNKLLLTLGEMVRLLDEPERLVAVIAPLGRRHAGYGVREPDYATATAALIGAMRDVMADAFTEEMAEGWRELHGLVSAVMVRAG